MEPGGSNSSAEQQNVKTPLWNHVELLERTGGGGGNVRFKCKYCKLVYSGSYSRVKAHLLKISNSGIKMCPKVTVPILTQLRSEVAKAEEELAKTKPKHVPLPTHVTSTADSVSVTSSSMGSKWRGTLGSALEKAFNNETRQQLDAMIARMFYSLGLSFNVARNPHYQSSYTFAVDDNISGYVPPGYNKLRTTLLQQERAHIESLLERTKSTWYEKGETICSDGWSDAQRRPLINFIAVSESAPMFLQAINAEGEVKTREYIAKKLIAVIEEVGTRNVVQVVTDNAANCKG